MNRIITIITLTLIALILISCANGRYPYPKSDLGRENWRSQVQTNSSVWARNASNWFRAGTTNTGGCDVRVASFNGIKAAGNFQIRITGNPNGDTVSVEGPPDAVRAMIVRVNNGILNLMEAKDAPPDMSQVIVHVNIRHLEYLEYNGSGLVEGVRLYSRHLEIISTGCVNMYLTGHVNVKCILANGSGTVNVFTVNSFGTDIETRNAGSVNISARDRVWLKNIKHKGSGEINVIGAASNGLVINTEGKGKIGIYGLVDIREIRASGQTCVFIRSSNSSSTCVYVYDDARVGIDGRAHTFNGYTNKTARLLIRDLTVQDLYVKATGQSHMNVYATNKIFATATGYATIYFYGDPNILTRFVSGDGAVINMGTPSSQNEAIVPCMKPHHKSRGPQCFAGGMCGESSYKVRYARPTEYSWRGRVVNYAK